MKIWYLRQQAKSKKQIMDFWTSLNSEIDWIATAIVDSESVVELRYVDLNFLRPT
ncbi:hypothetical protein GCM10011282_05960 [Undibacterium macrobrachii]|jgi:hypothetical protein|uniref:Uncharacterized protein n=1 Tax=Undibacterium macrobrachii TaxID=1119058 RepID=A0ABQ2X774_9BURK|nr:hypothetical protein GCM10011282_05960 [Undibacterium macrobrachii]